VKKYENWSTSVEVITRENWPWNVDPPCTITGWHVNASRTAIEPAGAPITIASAASCCYPRPLGAGIKRWCCLTSVAYIGRKSRTVRPRKTKIGTRVAHVTRDSDTTFKVKRPKVKVTRPLCSPPYWHVRQLQRWAWECVGRGKLLLHCRLLGGARRFGAHWGSRGAGAYRGGRPPTLVYSSVI